MSAPSANASARPSLRRVLMLRLLLVTAAVALVGTALIDVSIDREIQRHTDRELGAQATVLQRLIVANIGRADFSVSEIAVRLGDPARTASYQLWNSEGRVLARAPNLKGADLVAFNPAALTQPKREYADLPMPSGANGRMLRYAFNPTPPGTSAAPVRGLLLLAVAHDVSDLIVLEHRLDWALVGTIFALLTTVSLATWMVLSRQLAPLRELVSAADKIGPDTPAARLSVAGLPQELEPLVRKFNAILQRMESGLTRERLLTRDLAHELRTPLAEIRSMIDISTRFPNELPNAECLEEISGVATQMESIISSLLLLTRLEAGLEAPARTRIALSELLNDLLPRAHLARIHCEIAEALVIQSDPTLLAVVVRNLLGNALLHGQEGSQVALRAVALNDSSVQIEISNFAVGLTEHDLGQMQRRFWQRAIADDESAQPTGGSGLGLAVCKSIASILGLSLEFSLRAAEPDQTRFVAVLGGLTRIA